MIHMQSLIDDAKCFATVRDVRGPDGAQGPPCASPDITKQGRDDTPPERQCYVCKACARRFDALTDTRFAGPHQPLRVWRLCWYCMGRNLSNAQMAHELDVKKGALVDADASKANADVAHSKRRNRRSLG
jgi:hypothetical protein